MDTVLLSEQRGMKDGKKMLMDLVHYRTYAKTKTNGKREAREETITRVKDMHQWRFPELHDEIEDAFKEVYKGKVVPSMRSLQFSGPPLLKSHARCFNCSYSPLTTWKDFADLFWLSMNGVGVGYSIQKEHINQLPTIRLSDIETFVIEDSKEGWSDSIIALLENPLVRFDYTLVRPKGAKISSGGVSSGPGILLEAHQKIRKILLEHIGVKLCPINCFDIMCFILNAVVVGGVRRSASIALFSDDDELMLNSKFGDWWEDNPQRARANISAVIDRKDKSLKDKIEYVTRKCFESNSGEPGIFLSNDCLNYGGNPCLEISLRNKGLCNLTEINATKCFSEEDFFNAVYSATIIGTLQASYTDFKYIHPDWKKNAEEDALLGVSITGQAQAWPFLTDKLLKEGAELAKEVNRDWAEKIYIYPAARITTTKPSGTTSAWWGTTSGIHAAHSEYYLRRVRVDKKDEFGKYLLTHYRLNEANSNEFLEKDHFSDENIIVAMPIKMNNAIFRGNENSISLLERAKHIFNNWIKPGHTSGPNTHNVSLTVSYKPNEQEEIIKWMCDNSDSWAGISLLPYDGGTYIQAPFEEISELEYYEWVDNKLPSEIDFGSITFGEEDIEAKLGELACVGANGCEII